MSAAPSPIPLVVVVGRTAVPVSDLAHAAQVVRGEIEARQLGSTAWSNQRTPRGTRPGDVVDRLTGARVAHVSYNGRTWSADRRTEVLA